MAYPNPFPSQPSGPQTLAGLRVGIYTRISDDKAQDTLGVGRQDQDSTEHAQRRGAASTKSYTENDTSAWKKKRLTQYAEDGSKIIVYRVVRPVWDEMIKDLRNGVIDAVVVYDIDRLVRDPRDLEDAIEMAQFFGKRFEGTTGSLDLNTDNGRAMARVMVAMANKASADTSRRVARKHREQAESGIPVGGWRPFGWKEDKRTIDDVEAKHIRDASEAIRAGVTPGAVINSWYDKGIKTPRGNSWQWATFMGMLRNPRLAGFRSTMVTFKTPVGQESQRWEIVTLADGTEVKGQWDAILDRAEWDALIGIIGKHAHDKKQHDQPFARRYLLSGFLRCGNCGSKIWGGATHTSAGVPYSYYRCPPARSGGCGQNSRRVAQVDKLIEKLVLEHHRRAQFEAADTDEVVDTAEDSADKARLEEIQEKLTEAYDAWKANQLKGGAYFQIRADLEAEAEEIEQKSANLVATTVDMTRLNNIADHWDDAGLHEQRAFVGRYLTHIVLHPIEDVWSERRKKMVHPRKFNPELLDPIWRKKKRPNV